MLHKVLQIGHSHSLNVGWIDDVVDMVASFCLCDVVLDAQFVIFFHILQPQSNRSSSK